MSFDTRYKQLNTEQRQAVDTIDGPLLVVAGPGTGKTELLSMRAANILRRTDTLPESILCLTFTDSGAAAMRARLASIIGPSAYKVAIHTFHSFGVEVINHNNQYFYHGAEFQPADDIASYEILTSIFDELDHNSPLAGKMNGEYTHLADTRTIISELKRAGLTSDELLAIINANEAALDTVESDISAIFANKVSTTMLSLLVPLAERVASLPLPQLPLGITPLSNVLALSMAHAFDEAVEIGKTTPITAWRNRWCEKNEVGDFVFKDRKRHAKLRAIAHIYFSYLARMEQAALYDYDDMILNVVHGIELHADLRYQLQEKYQYIMVDEFQDTNLAQLRILFNLTTNHLVEDVPNVMAVGDDDQAIYSFQGADVSNIHRFRETYPSFKSIVLRQNYRSTQTILDRSRQVITQGENRLETTMEISKELTSNRDSGSEVTLVEHSMPTNERYWLAKQLADQIDAGTKPSDIAVLARRHNELIELLPYLAHFAVPVNYERRDNVLDLEPIQTLELLAEIIVALFAGDHDLADSMLPDLLAHPMFEFSPEAVWRLSIASHRNRLTWLEGMLTTPTFEPLATWLIAQTQAVPHASLETFLDSLIGTPTVAGDDIALFTSPYYNYYFSANKLQQQPDAYVQLLEALRALRTKLRDYQPDQPNHITDFLECIRVHRQINSPIVSVRSAAAHQADAICLMTAHKSKGLEFEHVYVIGSIDSSWGATVRSRSRLIGYPQNLLLSPNADSYDERLRLYYVAMTRAKTNLTLSYSLANDNNKPQLVASFLVELGLTSTRLSTTSDVQVLQDQATVAWRDKLISQPNHTLRELLQPTLDAYRISATHLNNFIDITRGGPQEFLMNNLLRFPQSKSPSASYGSAIHRALQRAHMHLITTGERRPLEDTLGDFIHELEHERMSEEDISAFKKRGTDSLVAFLKSSDAIFRRTQKTELSFASQGVQIGEACLTGSLDLLDIDDGHITVTDYKTGKPSRDWKGKTDADKVKLHKYRQQLMFYQLLCESSRDYSKYTFDGGILQFVEPDASGSIHALRESFTSDELDHFRKLIQAVWHCVTTLELPDTSEFEPNYKGILAFEEYLIDKYA